MEKASAAIVPVVERVLFIGLRLLLNTHVS